jgi:hypothetical protein
MVDVVGQVECGELPRRELPTHGAIAFRCSDGEDGVDEMATASNYIGDFIYRCGHYSPERVQLQAYKCLVVRSGSRVSSFAANSDDPGASWTKCSSNDWNLFLNRLNWRRNCSGVVAKVLKVPTIQQERYK